METKRAFINFNSINVFQVPFYNGYNRNIINAYISYSIGRLQTNINCRYVLMQISNLSYISTICNILGSQYFNSKIQNQFSCLRFRIYPITNIFSNNRHLVYDTRYVIVVNTFLKKLFWDFRTQFHIVCKESAELLTMNIEIVK